MQFSINRFFNLVRRDLIVYKKPLALVVGGAAVLLFLICTLIYISNENNARDLSGDFWSVWMTIMLLGGGAIFTTSVFWEFRNSDSRLGFLVMPASNFEKTISRWIYTFVLYPIAVISIIYIVYSICKLLFPGVSWAGEDFRQYFRPASQIFILGHCLLFMFAVWYNRYTAPKAAITSFLVFIVTMLCVMCLLYITFNDVFESPFKADGNVSVQPKEDFQFWIEDSMGPLLHKLALIIPPIFFLVVSYFKMKEKEV